MDETQLREARLRLGRALARTRESQLISDYAVPDFMEHQVRDIENMDDGYEPCDIITLDAVLHYADALGMRLTLTPKD